MTISGEMSRGFLGDTYPGAISPRGRLFSPENLLIGCLRQSAWEIRDQRMVICILATGTLAGRRSAKHSDADGIYNHRVGKRRRKLPRSMANAKFTPPARHDKTVLSVSGAVN